MSRSHNGIHSFDMVEGIDGAFGSLVHSGFCKVRKFLWSYVCMDTNTTKKERFDFACILIEMANPFLHHISATMKIDGKGWTILVEKELSLYVDGDHPKKKRKRIG